MNSNNANMEQERKNNTFNKNELYMRGILFLISFTAIILFGISSFYNIKLEKQIAERDNMIAKLTQSDSIMAKYFEIKEDTLQHMRYFTPKEGLFQKEYIVHTPVIEIISDTGKISFDIEELYDRYKLLQDSLDLCVTKLQAIQRNYPDIQCEIGNTDKGYWIAASSSRIDSALMLLPFYRDNLQYDTIKGSWFVIKTTIQ